jgi:hypothetical protein
MPAKTEAAAALSAELVAHLQGPQLVLVTTLDVETGWPTNNLITWVLARDAATLRLVADGSGRVLRNIEGDSRVLLTVMAVGGCYSIEGHAAVIAAELPAQELKLGMAEVTVQAVRDVLFWGGRLTEGPHYDVTYDRELKERLDADLFAAMRRG